jgi:hypothetical protein
MTKVTHQIHESKTARIARIWELIMKPSSYGKQKQRLTVQHGWTPFGSSLGSYLLSLQLQQQQSMVVGALVVNGCCMQDRSETEWRMARWFVFFLPCKRTVGGWVGQNVPSLPSRMSGGSKI